MSANIHLVHGSSHKTINLHAQGVVRCGIYVIPPILNRLVERRFAGVFGAEVDFENPWIVSAIVASISAFRSGYAENSLNITHMHNVAFRNRPCPICVVSNDNDTSGFFHKSGLLYRRFDRDIQLGGL